MLFFLGYLIGGTVTAKSNAKELAEERIKTIMYKEMIYGPEE